LTDILRVLDPELVKDPLNVRSFDPPIKPLPPQIVLFEMLRAPLTAVNPAALVSVNVPVENALSFPIFTVVPVLRDAPATVVDPVYVFVPLNVIFPPAVSANAKVILLTLEITPLIVRLPPLPDWVIVCVPEAAPKTMGAATVLIPLVVIELIALDVVVPVLVRVSLVAVIELVTLYPEDVAVEKLIP